MIEITTNNVTYGVECIKKNNFYEYKFYKDGDDNSYKSFNSVHSPVGYMKVDAWYKELLKIAGKCNIYSYANEHDMVIDVTDYESIDRVVELIAGDYCQLLEDDVIIDEDNKRYLEDIIIIYNKDTNNYEIISKHSKKNTKPQLVFDKNFRLDDCWVLTDIQSNIQSNMMKNYKNEIKTLKRNHENEIKQLKKNIKEVLNSV